MSDVHSSIRLSPAQRRHVERMRDYIHNMEEIAVHPRDHIHGVEGLPHVLCYDTGLPGKSAAIIAGTHMSELTGFAAATHFHDRWLAGERPASGKVYVVVGGHVPSVEHLIGRLLEPNPTITESEQISYRTAIYNEYGSLVGRFNHNDIPLRYRDEREAMERENPLLQRVGRIVDLLSACNAGVLDIHSLTEDTLPDALPYTSVGDDQKTTLRKLDHVIRGMPIHYVPLFRDDRHLKPGDKGYEDAVCGLRSFAHIAPDAVSLLVETGGHLSERSWSHSETIVDAWLDNIGMLKDPNKWRKHEETPERILLEDIGNLYHPTNYPPERMREFKATMSHEGKTPEQIEAIIHDHYFLIHSLDQLHDGPAQGFSWSPAARDSISQAMKDNRFGDRTEGRLNFFAPVKKGDVIAIGLNTGHIAAAERDGHVLMVNKDPDLSKEGTALGYQGDVLQRNRAITP